MPGELPFPHHYPTVGQGAASRIKLMSSSNRFAVTVSYINRISSSAAGRTYALIMLNTAARSGLLVVESSSSLGYQPVCPALCAPHPTVETDN
jgi:hypothetical protein